MLHKLNNDLKNKALCLLLVSISILSIGLYLAINSLDNVIEHYDQTIAEDVQQMKRVSALNLNFKIQVQEWKNTLIRGHLDDKRKKYWGRFNDKAQLIQQEYQQLLQVIPRHHPAFEHVEKFADIYPSMIDAYHEGYKAFVETNYNIPIADKKVSGIDRQPTKSLTAAVEAMNQFISESSHVLLEKSNAARQIAYASIVFCALFSVFLFSWFMKRYVLSPINQLADVSTKIASGDFTSPIKEHSQDQLGQLAVNFELIQTNLSELINIILSDLQQVTELTDDLFGRAEELNQRLNLQASHTHDLRSHVNNMSEAGSSITQSIHHANTFLNDSSTQLHQGQNRFEKNLQSGENMLNATLSAANIIGGLQQNSDDIGQIVTVINGIAEQTNLLALNAAIEAARAGESGRGFAVVADEVRSLATKTQQSTKQISNSIEQLQNAANQAVEAMQEGQIQAKQSVEQMRASEQFINDLHNAFSQIKHFNQQVEASVGTQQDKCGDVSRGLQEIESLSDNSQKEAEKVALASRALSDINTRLHGATQRFQLRH